MNSKTDSILKNQFFKLPLLYKDSYEAVRIVRGNIFIFVIGIFFVIASLFKESSELLRLRKELILPTTFFFLIIFSITLFVYSKYGFESKIFKYFDFINKFVLLTVIAIIIYFTKDPRTAWWVPYILFVVLVSQLSEFHWFHFLTFLFYPAFIGTLYLTDVSFGFSIFHKSFPYFIGLVSAILYYFQCRLKHSELMIKENNLQLVNELNDLKIILDRERISRDLHDNLGASLTGNIIYTEIAKEELHKDIVKTEEMLDLIENLSRDALVKMREAVYSIMEDKELLYNFSLYLLTKCQELLKMKKINFQYNCPTEVVEKLSSKGKFNLYQVIREWLTNILKHSNASDVSLAFTLIDQKVHVLVIDNGKGFNHNKIQDGTGINNITYRVKEIGGKLNISSKPGEGSQLEIDLPLQISNVDT